jgi:methionyl-tRNA synthetase
MKEEINIDDFNKIDLKVGKILSADNIEGADKLLKFQVDIGEKEIKVLSGIAEYYNPEELIGWKVIVVVNLEPVKLRGELSEGMLLCASREEKVTLIKLNDSLKIGSTIK